MHMKTSLSRKIFQFFNVTFMILFAILCVYPILNQIALSLSSPEGILAHNVTFYPIDFSLETYKAIINQSNFWLNYKNTVIYTAVGTLISIVMTTMAAYPLSKKDLFGRSMVLKYMVFTMFFGGGMIPTYLLIKNLGMLDTIWAIVVPGAIAPYSVLMMRAYFQGLPVELEDAAAIDGLTQFKYFLKMAIPLSKPIIATMVLFSSVGYWNDWFAALLYMKSDAKYPVTLYLRNIMMGATVAVQNGNKVDASATVSIPQSVQATAMLLVILPILCVYPFVQKYFTKGMLVGSVKG